ncbi:MAG TPA: DSD1 family PLP-dependent enzyme [Hyphomicrobiales bacterium]|nr:DSD1 family PLP-dependent enzyme [Hyphomicrobiales bacterium]
MIPVPPAQIGAAFSGIDTPALLIDLDAFERNLDAMAEFCAQRPVRLRPHAKTHKSPIIAAKQIARGACGICCQKLSEAEAMVAAGIGNVLITNEIIGEAKLARLASLARQAQIGVCADNAAAVDAMAAAAEQFGSRLDVLVEIDVGGRRCGVPPGAPAAELAQRIAAKSTLNFAGLQAYHGAAQHLRLPSEREAAVASARAAAEHTLHLLKSAGLSCNIIGGGGTGTVELEAASGVWNELQPGSYIFMDADYAKNKRDAGAAVPAFEHSLYVLASVMSLSSGRAVVDVGHKALSNDSGFPAVLGKAGVAYGRPSDEHGVLEYSEQAWSPALGEKVLLIPGHCDPTVNLYDWYVGVRQFGTPKAHVECLWPVAARGALI